MQFDHTVSPQQTEKCIMTPEVRALLRPVVRTVALLLALALGAIACLLVLLRPLIEHPRR
jgi:hypothetical protein